MDARPRYEPAPHALEAKPARLGVDCVDLCLRHWQVPSDVEPTIVSYMAAGKALREGRACAIGV